MSVLGAPVRNFSPPPVPRRVMLAGRYAGLEPLRAEHADDLHAAFRGHDALWDYMPTGPFGTVAAYRDWVASVQSSTDPVFLAIQDLASERYLGVASFLRIAPRDGSIEVGYITFAPALQRTRAATEAMYLMMRWAFEAGYRRYEWKCNALNQASRRAAQRLGFSYEGIFRQATVVKGRNRDTAWFAAIDAEWPALRSAFETWLDPGNFDSDTGAQIRSLSDLTAPILAAPDPGVER